MAARSWTCQRQSNGVKCGTLNARRLKLCAKCRKPRPATKRPAHMAALRDFTYEDYIALNGGEHCAICGALPNGRRLHRDHEHVGDGRPRGLLCWPCNSRLTNRVTPEWLRAAAAYLERPGRPADGSLAGLAVREIEGAQRALVEAQETLKKGAA